MLEACYKKDCFEAGLDEAGRGCLAGPVYAAAVILPPDYNNHGLRDSKTLNSLQRNNLRKEIEKYAICYSVQSVDEKTIDRINILRASVKAMHLAIDVLSIKPKHLIIDGNYFLPFSSIPFQTIVKGDNLYMSIAAASILAKTYRDDMMAKIHDEFPEYCWVSNKGYGTKTHIAAIKKHGLTPYHRRSFHIKSLEQISLFESLAL